MTIWSGIKECKDNIWQSVVRSRPQKSMNSFIQQLYIMNWKQWSQFISMHSTNFSDLTWGRLGVTAVEPQFVLLLIFPFLKVVQTLVIVLHLQTIQYNTGHLPQADTDTTPPNKRTCPNALTFSVGMNMPGYTFCRYHLKGLQFSLFLKL
jgi:hypothetical protein